MSAASPDWSASAELFSNTASARLGHARYKRFGSTAEAVGFAIEQLPASSLRSVTIESGENRYQGQAIRALYDGLDYPLERAAL